MNKVKIGFFFVFLFLVFNQGYCQSYKFKTTGLSVSQKEKDGKFGKWTDLDLSNILITLDTKKNRVIVYSEVIQVFEIVEYLPTEENETDLVYPFICKDTNGEDSTLSFITRKNQNNRKQLYIKYEDRVIAYDIVNHD